MTNQEFLEFLREFNRENGEEALRNFLNGFNSLEEEQQEELLERLSA